MYNQKKMKHMKRNRLIRGFLSLLMTASMLGGLTACGNEDNPSDDGVKHVMYVRIYGHGLNDGKVFLMVGASLQLDVSVYPQSAVDKNVRWVSSDQSVVSASPSGLINALKSGHATVKVVSTDKPDVTHEINVIVSDDVNVTYNDEPVNQEEAEARKR